MKIDIIDVSLRPKCTLLYQLLKNVYLDVYYFLNLDVLLKPSMEELYQTELRKRELERVLLSFLAT